MTQIPASVKEIPASVIADLVKAVVARDFLGAQALMDPEVNFRAMTPKRTWEADDPPGVGEVLRAWFEHPEREVERVEPTEPGSVEDTARVGWRVYGTEAGKPFVYEQQAFLREDGGKVVWMRVMCSGPRPAAA
jgi:ketosteroid isomerase-like protein